MNNIFVGNLSFAATKEDVQKLFEPFGTVVNVVVMERKKGKSRGYAFVDMPNEEERARAIEGLEGKEFKYRVLSVSVVIPKVPGESKPKKKFKSPEGGSKPWFKSDEEPREDKRSFRPGDDEEFEQDRGARDDRFEDNRSSKPWVKKEGGSSKPWGKLNKDFQPTGNTRYEGKPRGEKKSWGGAPKSPYKKFEGSSKPWEKKESSSSSRREGGSSSRPSYGSSKPPYKKFEGSSKPWEKKEGGSSSKPPYKKFEGSKKFGGSSKPSWGKSESSSSRPRRDEGKSSWGEEKSKNFSKATGKPGGAFKMFHKSPGKPSFKPWPKKGDAGR